MDDPGHHHDDARPAHLRHLVFREGRAGDVPAISALIERENHRPADPGRIARRLESLPSVVVEDAGALVAFIHCRRFSPDMVELSNMVVASSIRRRGVGTAMVGLLEPALAAAGYRAAIFVNCRLHEGATDARVAVARDFWRRQGYAIVFATAGSAVFARTLPPAG